MTTKAYRPPVSSKRKTLCDNFKEQTKTSERKVQKVRPQQQTTLFSLPPEVLSHILGFVTRRTHLAMTCEYFARMVATFSPMSIARISPPGLDYRRKSTAKERLKQALDTRNAIVRYYSEHSHRIHLGWPNVKTLEITIDLCSTAFVADVFVDFMTTLMKSFKAVSALRVNLNSLLTDKDAQPQHCSVRPILIPAPETLDICYEGGGWDTHVIWTCGLFDMRAVKTLSINNNSYDFNSEFWHTLTHCTELERLDISNTTTLLSDPKCITFPLKMRELVLDFSDICAPGFPFAAVFPQLDKVILTGQGCLRLFLHGSFAPPNFLHDFFRTFDGNFPLICIDLTGYITPQCLRPAVLSLRAFVKRCIETPGRECVFFVQQDKTHVCKLYELTLLHDLMKFLEIQSVTVCKSKFYEEHTKLSRDCVGDMVREYKKTPTV